MKQYDSYKDSGIEWIGEIPSHWILMKFGYLFHEKSSTNNLSLRTGSISFGNVVYKDDESIPLERKETYQELLKDEFLVNPLNLNYDLKSLRIGLSDIDVVVSPGYIVLQLKGGNKKYFNYLLRTFDTQHMKSLGNGIRQTISFKHLSTEYISLPPLSEQEHIVSYLDEKTTKIDELIQKKLKKIDLLKEYRTSLINTIVTKGLNPNVPMKDSGIEWIGEIPSHWEKSRLDFLFRLYGRVGWKSLKSDEYVEDGYVFLSTPNIKDKVIDYVNVNYITKERYDESPEIMLENGDVLLVKDGSTLGIVNIVVDLPRPSTVNSSIGVLKKISDKISPMFMYYHLTSDYHQNIINRIKGGMGVPHLFQSDIKKFYVILPPISEQEHIVSYLDEKTSQIDKTIDIEKKKIELLKEYRQSLISNVVTGKIKVIE
jgi:type I restriction enzyme S subunit